MLIANAASIRFAATADVPRLRLCVEIFFSPFFFFCYTKSTHRYATCLRANVRVSFIFTQRYRRMSAGTTLGCSIPDRLKGFITLEKEEILKSIVPHVRRARRVCDSERVVVYSGIVDLCLGVNALTWLWIVICRSARRVKPERVLTRDWEINACQAGRCEKSCNQSPESHF